MYSQILIPARCYTMRRLASLFLCSLLIVAVTSCDTNLNQTDPNELTSENFYETKSQALSGLFAVYDVLQEEGLYSRHQYFNLDMLAEEAVGTGSLQGALNPVNTRTYGPPNGSLAATWDALYLGIKRANLVLEKLPETEDLSSSERSRMQAEARFLRAFYYYELAALWEDVPLLTEVKDDVGGVPLSSEEEVYNQVFSDVEFAEQNLPLKSSIASNMLGRVPRGAAYMLEGRARLMRGNWEEARAAFQEVSDSGEYQLVDQYFDNFKEETENNAESIFEAQFTLDPGSWNWGLGGSADHTWRRQEYGWLDWNNVLITDRLYNEFESDDPRRDMSFYEICDSYNGGNNTVLGGDQFPDDPSRFDCGLSDSEANAQSTGHPQKPSWRKYENYYRTAGNSNFGSGINFRILRYAEAFVGLAEAQVELGNMTARGNGSVSAVETLNWVRSRPTVNMPDISTVFNMGDPQEATEAVYHEYASKFAGEQVLIFPQVRRLDFWRDWAGEEASKVKRFLPIPQSEVDANPAISVSDQPEGY